MDSVIPKTEDLDGWFEEFITRDAGTPLTDLDMAYIRLMKRWADKGRRRTSNRLIVALGAEALKNQAARLLKDVSEGDDEDV